MRKIRSLFEFLEEAKDDPPVVDAETSKMIWEGRYPCPSLLDLQDFAAGEELDPECRFSRADIEEHLKHCPECQRDYPTIQRIVAGQR